MKKSSAGVVSTNSSHDLIVQFSDTSTFSDPENSRNILLTYFSPDIYDNLSSFPGSFKAENVNKTLKNELQCCCNKEIEMPNTTLLVPRPSAPLLCKF